MGTFQFLKLARWLSPATKKQTNYIGYLSQNKKLPKKLEESCKPSELKKLTRIQAIFLIDKLKKYEKNGT